MKKVAITMGDPFGIGPEILYHALKSVKDKISFVPVLVGNPNIYKKLNIKPEQWFLDLFDRSFQAELQASLGDSCREGGMESYRYLEKSVSLVKAKEVVGIINAPVSKSAISMVQTGFLGHTGFYEDHISQGEAVMTFYGKHFSMVLLSHHIPLKDVSDFLLKNDLEATAKIALDGFSKLYGRSLNVKILGVNPHAGESGLISHGEDDRLSQLVKNLNQSNHNVTGPYPADTLFAGNNLGTTDLIISGFHDQGLIPFKLMHFQQGVSITWGLDVPRMTVDHGTAYDLAGKSQAKHESMVEVIYCMDRTLKEGSVPPSF